MKKRIKHFKPIEGDSELANNMRNILAGLYNLKAQCGDLHANISDSCSSWISYYEARLKKERSKKKARFIP